MPSSTSISSSSPFLQQLKLTAAELESNLAAIAETLQDTTTHDWTKRIAALHHLTSIALGCLPSFHLFLSHFRPLRAALSAQILDLRSSVVKETCSALSTIAQAAGDAFSDEADVFLPQLVRLISVSVQVIAQSGDDCIRTLLRFTQPRHATQKLIEHCSASSAITRLRCLEYTLHWMQVWAADPDYLSRWETALSRLIADKLGDKTEGVRATARKAAIVYASIWPEQGKRLFDSLDEKVRRLIDEERGRAPPTVGEVATAEAPRPRSVSRKSLRPVRKEAQAVVVDKENSHPNAASLASLTPPLKAAKPPLPPPTLPAGSGRPPLAPQPPSAASFKAARRTSFSLQSVTAVEGDSGASATAGGSSRLGGAQRVLPTAPVTSSSAPATAGQTRARRLSIVPVQTALPLVSSQSPSPSPLSAPASAPLPPHESGSPLTPSTSVGPSTVLPSQAASSTAYEALLTSSVSLELHAAIDAAFADLHRKPRSVAASRRQSQAFSQSAPLAPSAAIAEEMLPQLPVPSRDRSASHKRKSLGPLPSSSTHAPHHRRASFSLSQSSAEDVPTPRPTTVASLLLLARDPVWSTRVSALESLASVLSSSELSGAEMQSHLDRVMYGLIERISDAHHKVASAALAAVLALLGSLASHPVSPSPLSPHLSALFPPLLLALSHPRLGVRQQANDSLNLLAQVVPQLALLAPLSLALTAKEGRVRRGAEEFFAYLVGVGDEEQRRKKRDCVDGLVGEAGKRARALLQSTSHPIAADLPETPSVAEEQPQAISPSEAMAEAEASPPSVESAALEEEAEAQGDEPSHGEVDSAAAEEVRETNAAATVTPLPSPLSVLLSPHHPINQPSSSLAPLAPPVQPSPSPQPSAQRAHPPLSPMATEALARFIQQRERSSHSLLAPPASPLLSPSSAPQSERAHRRAPSAPSVQTKSHSASKPSHRPHSSSVSSSRPTQPHSSTTRKARSTKQRLAVLSPPPSISPSAPGKAAVTEAARMAHVGSSKVLQCDAYDGRLSNADVGALIYQWKHADLAVVRHSFQWMQALLTKPCTLSASALDRLTLALIDAAQQSAAVRDDVLAVFAALLSSPSPSPQLRAHLTSAAFPHTAALMALLLTIHHAAAGDAQCRSAVEAVWDGCLGLHRPTVLATLVGLLGSTGPVHRESLTLVLVALHGVVGGVEKGSVERVMGGLAAQLTVLLGHEHVLIRKHAVKVWVCVWEVLGEAVEPYLAGMSGVSRKLVDIYLKKAREEKASQQR